MKILLPFDGKPHSQKAADLVLRCFDLSGIDVTLLHVVEPAAPELVLADKTGNLENRHWQTSKEEAEALLSVVGKPFEKAGAKVEVLIERGLPGMSIRSIAESGQFPIVVTTPGKHSGADKMLNSTVTNQLLQIESETLLILAKELPPKDELPIIAFLLDSHSASIKALSTLSPMLSDKTVTVIAASEHAWQPLSSGHFFRVDGDISESESIPPNELLDEAGEILDQLNIPYERRLLEGSYEDNFSVVEKIRNFGLVVAARTREDVLHRPLKGSAPERLFVKLHCSSALYCAPVRS